VRRHVAGGPRVEGRSWAAPVTGEWFRARVVIADAPELPDAEGGVRRIVQRAQLICEPDVDIPPYRRDRGGIGDARRRPVACRWRGLRHPHEDQGARGVGAGGKDDGGGDREDHSVNPLRSLAKYCALALPDFELRWGDSLDFSRPFARVTTATGVVSVPIGARCVERRQTYSVIAYPTTGLNAESSTMEAARVERLLLVAIAQGLDTTAWREGRGHPLRVPLYDYSGLGLRDAATEEQRLGWMRVVESPEFEIVPDPSESGGLAVVCDLRLAWTESVAVAIDGPILRRVSSAEAVS
jgi:hypothetical protein